MSIGNFNEFNDSGETTSDIKEVNDISNPSDGEIDENDYFDDKLESVNDKSTNVDSNKKESFLDRIKSNFSSKEKDNEEIQNNDETFKNEDKTPSYKDRHKEFVESLNPDNYSKMDTAENTKDTSDVGEDDTTETPESETDDRGVKENNETSENEDKIPSYKDRHKEFVESLNPDNYSKMDTAENTEDMSNADKEKLESKIDDRDETSENSEANIDAKFDEKLDLIVSDSNEIYKEDNRSESFLDKMKNLFSFKDNNTIDENIKKDSIENNSIQNNESSYRNKHREFIESLKPENYSKMDETPTMDDRHDNEGRDYYENDYLSKSIPERESNNEKVEYDYSDEELKEIWDNDPGYVNEKAYRDLDDIKGNYKETGYHNDGLMNYGDDAVENTEIERLLPVGKVLERYGLEYGNYLTEPGSKYEDLHIIVSEDKRPKHIYEVVRPFYVTESEIAPQPFDENSKEDIERRAIQYKSDLSVIDLVDQGFLRRVDDATSNQHGEDGERTIWSDAQWKREHGNYR